MAKGVGTSSGFSRTGVNVANLSEPNLQGASHVRQGVVDDSRALGHAGVASAATQSAAALGAVIQGGLDIDEGFARAKVERGVEDEIQAFKDSRNPELQGQLREEGQTALENSAVLTQQSNALFATLGEDGVSSQDTVKRLNELGGEFTNEISKFKRAQDQGVMSQTELELNVLKVTREAINRRPGLARELTQHAETTLNLSGARELASFEDSLDEAVNKDNEQARRDIETQARSLGIFFDPRAADHDSLVIDIQSALVEKQSWDALKQSRDNQEFLNTEQADIFIKARGQQAAMGGYSELIKTSSELITPNMSTAEFTEAKVKMGLMRDTFQGTLQAAIAANGAAGLPAANKLLDTYTTMSNRYMDMMESITSGDEAKRIVENQVNVMRGVQNAGYLTKFDEPTMNTMIRLSGSLPFIFESQDDSSQKLFADITDSLIKGSLNSGAMSQSLDSSFTGKDTDLSTIITNALPGLVAGDNETGTVKAKKDPQTFEKMINSTLDFLNNPSEASNDRAKFSTLESITKEFGTEESRQYLNNATLGTKASLGEMYNNYAQVLTRSRDENLANFADRGINIQTRILPDGRIVYTSDDTAAARQMNNNVGSRYNELVNAYAVLFNQSRAQTSSLLGKAFSGGSSADIISALDSRSSELAQARETKQAGSDSFMDKMIQVESGGNPNAKASTSSAVGLAQFTEETFLNVVQDTAPELMEGKTRNQVLELRKDGAISKQMAQALADDNARIMARSNVDTTDRNLYLAHFLGAGQAVRVLKADPSAAVEGIINQAAINANKSVLQNKSIQDVIDWAEGKMAN